MHIHVHVGAGVCVCKCVWRPMTDRRYPSVSHSSLFSESGNLRLSRTPEPAGWAGIDSQLSDSIPPAWYCDCSSVATCPSIFMVARYLNFSPQICAATTLSIVPSPLGIQTCCKLPTYKLYQGRSASSTGLPCCRSQNCSGFLCHGKCQAGRTSL